MKIGFSLSKLFQSKGKTEFALHLAQRRGERGEGPIAGLEQSVLSKGRGECASRDAYFEFGAQPAQREDAPSRTMRARESSQGRSGRTIDRQGAFEPQHDPPCAAAGDVGETLLELIRDTEKQVSFRLQDRDRLAAGSFIDGTFDQKS